MEPDIAVFAKAMSNGYAMAAVIGREDVMQAAQDTFISSTNWTERIGPAAALATIAKYRRRDVAAHIMAVGRRMMDGWNAAAARAGLALEASGLSSLAHFTLDYEDAPALNTLFTQIMLERGYLGWHQFKPSFAHDEEAVDTYLAACDEVFPVIKQAADAGDALERLSGPPARPGFYRLT